MIQESKNIKSAFTLIELLVVVSIIALLVSILLPSLAAARDQARSALCKNNIRQISIASLGYTLENNDYFVPAAPDLHGYCGGLRRWHGVRDNTNETFDPKRSPLIDYLQDGQIKECPQRVSFVKEGPWDDSFEKGCGGYGYNFTYLGSKCWSASAATFSQMYNGSARTTQVAAPSETIMFTDAASTKLDENGNRYYIEYSFAEPVYSVFNGQLQLSAAMSPTIHFRHNNRANAAWVDGHVSDRTMTTTDDDNFNALSSELKLGWFGPLNNSLFDLQ